MSDHSTGPAAEHSPVTESGSAAPAAADFQKFELDLFVHDDVTAGTAIGRMLATIFLYTIFAMAVAGWWTFRAVS